MGWELKLPGYAKDKLQQLERNARSIYVAQPDTAKGTEARDLLLLIEEEKARRALPGNIASFLETFPLGFQDPLYLKEERDEKVEASNFCKQALTREAFENAELDPDQLISDVKRLVNMTNLIQGSFEKPKLFDAIRDPRNTVNFTLALAQLMHGEGSSADRLEDFSSYLNEIGLRKWTYGTYFLFMNDPTSEMFVKPEGIKKAVEIADFPLDYDPAPTARVYRQVLEFGKWIDVRLRQSGHSQLVPGDNIDTQSFIWRMAPTGRFAK